MHKRPFSSFESDLARQFDCVLVSAVVVQWIDG